MGLRPFRQVADTWPLRPAGNHSNPCGTQTYEASSNFDECKQPAGRKNLSSLLHKRRENGSTRFKIEFQIPPRRHSISPNRRALHSKGGIQMSETRWARPAIRFTRGTDFGATLVRDCYGLSGCWPPCTDLTGLPANGGFYFQAFNGSVVLPAVGYDYNSDWTPLLAGLSPAGMAASLAALVRPCSGPASKRSWQGAPKTRSTPCHTSSILQSP